MKKLSDFVMKAEEIAIFILLLGMVASSFAQVVFRLVLDHPLAWSEELSRYLFVWLSFVGGALAVAEGSHFKMDLLAALIKDQRKKIIIDIIVSIAILIFSLVLIIYGAKLVTMVQTQKSPALRVSMSIPYLALPLNGVLSSFHVICSIVEDIKRFRNKVQTACNRWLI